MIKAASIRVALPIMVVVAVGGCTKDMGIEEAHVSEPLPANLGIMATEALSAATLQDLLVASSPDLLQGGSFSFVSMPPGSLAFEGTALLHNNSNGFETRTNLLNGGFDPVPVAAVAGDQIEVTFEQAGVITGSTIIIIPIEIPPIIVRTVPPHRRPSVPLSVTVAVVFSEPIDPATVSEASLSLRSEGGVVPAELTISNDGTRIEIKPADLLEPLTNYEIVADSGLKDISGLRLGNPGSMSFSTGTAVEPFAVKLVPDTLVLPVGSYGGFGVLVDSGLTAIDRFPDTSLAWRSLTPEVVSVDWVGNVGGVTTGEGWVAVEWEGEVDSALVIVTESPPPGPFGVFPNGWSAPEGVELQFEVTHPLDTPEPAVTWWSTNADVVTIDEQGLAFTTGVGVAYVVATDGTETDSAEVEVVPPDNALADGVVIDPSTTAVEVGGSVQLALIPIARDLPTGAVWTVETGPGGVVGSIDQSGLFTGLAEGMGMAGVMFEDGSGVWAQIEVVPVGTLGAIALTANPETIVVGDTVVFEVVVDSVAGARFAGESFSWSYSSTGRILDFLAAEAMAVGLAKGSAEVTVHLGPLAATTVVVVED